MSPRANSGLFASELWYQTPLTAGNNFTINQSLFYRRESFIRNESVNVSSFHRHYKNWMIWFYFSHIVRSIFYFFNMVFHYLFHSNSLQTRIHSIAHDRFLFKLIGPVGRAYASHCFSTNLYFTFSLDRICRIVRDSWLVTDLISFFLYSNSVYIVYLQCFYVHSV